MVYRTRGTTARISQPRKAAYLGFYGLCLLTSPVFCVCSKQVAHWPFVAIYFFPVICAALVAEFCRHSRIAQIRLTCDSVWIDNERRCSSSHYRCKLRRNGRLRLEPVCGSFLIRMYGWVEMTIRDDAVVADVWHMSWVR